MDRFQDRASVRRRTLVVVASLAPLPRRTEVESLVAARDRYLAAAVIDELAEEKLLELIDTGVARVRLTDSGRAELIGLPGEGRPSRGHPGTELPNVTHYSVRVAS